MTYITVKKPTNFILGNIGIAATALPLVGPLFLLTSLSWWWIIVISMLVGHVIMAAIDKKVGPKIDQITPIKKSAEPKWLTNARHAFASAHIDVAALEEAIDREIFTQPWESRPKPVTREEIVNRLAGIDPPKQEQKTPHYSAAFGDYPKVRVPVSMNDDGICKHESLTWIKTKHEPFTDFYTDLFNCNLCNKRVFVKYTNKMHLHNPHCPCARHRLMNDNSSRSLIWPIQI